MSRMLRAKDGAVDSLKWVLGLGQKTTQDINYRSRNYNTDSLTWKWKRVRWKTTCPLPTGISSVQFIFLVGVLTPQIDRHTASWLIAQLYVCVCVFLIGL